MLDATTKSGRTGPIRAKPLTIATRIVVGVTAALTACASADDPAAPPAGDATFGGNTDGSSSTGDPDGGADSLVVVDPSPPPGSCTLAGPPALDADASTLVWADEFDGTDVDPNKWTVLGADYATKDAITNNFDPSCVTLGDGKLHITTMASPAGATKPWITGRIDSHRHWVRTYGRIEIRARFPYEPGIWYAMWALPWDSIMPEIDIELLNSGSMQLYYVNHWEPPSSGLPADQRRAYQMTKFDFSDWHTYTVRWKPDSVEWQVDSRPAWKQTGKGVPHVPIGWMINAWVGGWGGAMTSATTVPTTFDVDYVRVYRDDGLLADPVIRVVNPHPSYPTNNWIEVEAANFDEACFHVRMYDGDTLVQTLTQPPWRFTMNHFGPGAHDLRFEATDGQRNAEVAFSTNTY